MEITTTVKQHMKAIVAILGATGVAVASAVTDDKITQAEWFTIGVAVITAIGVYWFKNEDPAAGDA